MMLSAHQPRRLAEFALRVVVVAGGLGGGFVARLLHGLGQRDAAVGGFGEKAGAQAVGGIGGRVETGGFDAGFEDEVDRLRIEALAVDMAPAVNAAEQRAGSDVGALEPVLQGDDRFSDENDALVFVRRRGLGAAEADCEAGQERGIGVRRIGENGFFLNEVLDAQRRHLAAPPPAGGKGKEQQRAVADIDQSVAVR